MVRVRLASLMHPAGPLRRWPYPCAGCKTLAGFLAAFPDARFAIVDQIDAAGAVSISSRAVRRSSERPTTSGEQEDDSYADEC
jgi:hypothetical protein